MDSLRCFWHYKKSWNITITSPIFTTSILEIFLPEFHSANCRVSRAGLRFDRGATVPRKTPFIGALELQFVAERRNVPVIGIPRAAHWVALILDVIHGILVLDRPGIPIFRHAGRILNEARPCRRKFRGTRGRIFRSDCIDSDSQTTIRKGNLRCSQSATSNRIIHFCFLFVKAIRWISERIRCYRLLHLRCNWNDCNFFLVSVDFANAPHWWRGSGTFIDDIWH